MPKLLLCASLAVVYLSMLIITPAAAVGLYSGPPIGSRPEVVEYALCLDARPSDKSLCDAQFEQRVRQQTPELQPNLFSDPKLLLLAPRLSDEERRHKEIMNGLQGIEEALRKR
jgi:hypothetical protein